jgi:hypothetical protein
MKIAYTTIYDSSDIHSWSGTGSFMRRALKESGLDLHDVKNLRMDPVSFCTSASKKMYYKLIARRDHLPIYDSVVQKSYEKAIRHKLSNHDLDVVFTPGSTLQAAIKSIKPRVFWADACFAGLVGFYPGYSNLSKESLRNGHMTEQQALSNSDLAIYSSDWAAATAIQH